MEATTTMAPGVTPVMRVESKTSKIADLSAPILAGMTSYAFIAMRAELPPYVEQVVYYLAWIALAISVFTILKIVVDLVQGK